MVFGRLTLSRSEKLSQLPMQQLESSFGELIWQLLLHLAELSTLAVKNGLPCRRKS